MVTKANLELMRSSRGDRLDHRVEGAAGQAAGQDAARCSCRSSTNATWPRSAAPDYPGERLVVCRNPLVAAERARKREELLAATEPTSPAIQRRVERGTLEGAGRDRPRGRRRSQAPPVKKHFQIEISDSTLHLRAQAAPRSPPRPPSTASTSCAPASQAQRLATAEVVRSYKRPRGGRARLRAPSKAPSSRSARSTTASNTASAPTSCSACSPTTSTWHLRQAWTPTALQRRTAAAQPPTPSPRQPAHPQAERKARTKRTTTGEPCHSYPSLDHRTRAPSPATRSASPAPPRSTPRRGSAPHAPVGTHQRPFCTPSVPSCPTVCPRQHERRM